MKSCMWEGRSLPLSLLHQCLNGIYLLFTICQRTYDPPFLSCQAYGTCFTTLRFPMFPFTLIDTLNRIFTLRRKTTLEKTGITHIVSVLKYDFKDFEDWEKYEHLNIEVDDVEDENLLGEFENTGKWIEEGLKNGKDGKKGGVLVHW